MADEIEIAKNSLDVLNEVFQLGSTYSQVSNIIKVSEKLASAFPVIGAILGLRGDFFPDGKHEEILRGLTELSNKIDEVRDDITDLEETIKWEIAELQYADHVNDIVLGMRYWCEIANASGKDKKMMYKKKLEALCANEYFNRALNSLVDGVAGNGLFNGSILDKFYDVTGGDRPRISTLATRLLQLVCGGMVVISTYETMMYGKTGADDVKFSYDRWNEACSKVKSVLDKCVKNFEGNMQNDLNKKLDEGGSNKGLVTEISDFMSDKYDWLENFCLVYNDLHGFAQHCFNGDRVSSLHRSGKCGIVFYRTKDEPPMFSDRYDEAYKIVNGRAPVHAMAGYNSIVARLGERGIEWTGCAVIKYKPDLRFGGTFSTKIIYVDKVDKINVVLDLATVTAETILLLK